jgi:hypothetical protein
MARIPKTELLLTYSDLSVRWNRSVGSLYVAAHRGYMPDPDYVIGNKPVWTEASIRQAERDNPTLARRQPATKGTQ